ncbi:hypothetical protein N7504_000077 [Penicillium tannophilum]|nr:hypothetical protein N7504_000077 [Penicillium tannophilum]
MTTCHLLVRWLLLIGILVMGVVGEEKVIVTVKTTVEAAKTVYETPTVPSPASYTSLSDFKEIVLQVSNEYRGSHEAEEVVWNETLVKYAQSWAETCIWKHSDGPYGENLAYGYPNASAAVEAWGMRADCTTSRNQLGTLRRQATLHNWCGGLQKRSDVQL